MCARIERRGAIFSVHIHQRQHEGQTIGRHPHVNILTPEQKWHIDMELLILCARQGCHGNNTAKDDISAQQGIDQRLYNRISIDHRIVDRSGYGN